MKVSEVQEIWLRNQEDIFSSFRGILIWCPVAVISGFLCLRRLPQMQMCLLPMALKITQSWAEVIWDKLAAAFATVSHNC